MESNSAVGGLVDGKPSLIDNFGLEIRENNAILSNPNLAVSSFNGTNDEAYPFESTRRDNTSPMTKKLKGKNVCDPPTFKSLGVTPRK